MRRGPRHKVYSSIWYHSSRFYAMQTAGEMGGLNQLEEGMSANYGALLLAMP